MAFGKGNQYTQLEQEKVDEGQQTVKANEAVRDFLGPKRAYKGALRLILRISPPP